MKDIFLKIIKFVLKIIVKLLKILFVLPYQIYCFGHTYDIDKLEEDIKSI